MQRTSSEQQRRELPLQDILQTLAHPHWGHVKGAHGVPRHGISTQLHHHGLWVELWPHFLHHTAKHNMTCCPPKQLTIVTPRSDRAVIFLFLQVTSDRIPVCQVTLAYSRLCHYHLSMFQNN